MGRQRCATARHSDTVSKEMTGAFTDYGPPTLAEAGAEFNKFARYPVVAGPPGGTRLSDRTVVAGEQQPRAALKLVPKRKRVGRVCHCNSLQVCRGTARDHNGRLAPLFGRIT